MSMAICLKVVFSKYPNFLLVKMYRWQDLENNPSSENVFENLKSKQ